MKRFIIAALTAALIASPMSVPKPASAQAAMTACVQPSIDGVAGAGNLATNSCLMQVLVQQVAQTHTGAANLGTNQASTAHLVTQIQNWIKDHNMLDYHTYMAGNQLLSQFLQNLDLINNQSNLDQSVVKNFSSLVPSYKGGDYLQYLVQQRNNQFTVYAQGLGVSNQALSNEKDVHAAVQRLASANPTNQIQALQQLVGLARIQIGQMSDLIKIQSAMLKSMSVAYSNWEPRGGSAALASSKAGYDACFSGNPFFALAGNLSSKAQALQQCQARARQAQSMLNH